MELEKLTALQLADKLKKKEVSVLDGVKEVFSKIEEKDGKIYVSSDASPEDTEKQVTGEGFPYNEGEYFITDYVLDAETTPDVRKEAALQAQKELADCMQVWGIPQQAFCNAK